jgi:hypothetical protein
MDATLEGMEALTVPLLHSDRGYPAYCKMHPRRSLPDMAAIYGEAIVLAETARDKPRSRPSTTSTSQRLAMTSKSQLSHTTYPCSMYSLLGTARNRMAQLTSGTNLYVLGNGTVRLLSSS